jgi:hypothetical protein
MFKKIKILLWVWNLLRKVKEMDKLKGVWEKLSGYKSLFGLLGVVGYFGAKQFGVEPPAVILEASYGLLGVGLAHKLDKATGIVSKVLNVLVEVMKVLDQKKKDEEKK